MRRRWRTPALLVAATSFAAACGSGSSGGAASSSANTVSAAPPAPSAPSAPPSPTGPNHVAALRPKAALRQVSSAAASQTSVRVAGSVVESGRKLSINVQAGLESGQGELRIGGGRVSLRLVGSTLYFNGDLKGLTGLGVNRASASGAADKWIGGPAANSPLSPFVSFADLITSILSPKGGVMSGKPKTIHGVRTFALVDKSTKGAGTLYVATVGAALPVRAVNATTHELLRFSNWSATMSVTPPPHAITLPPASSTPTGP
jgi:hypothetical protein